MNLVKRANGDLNLKLSRRNLLTLIKCLDMRVSKPSIHRDTGGSFVIVTAEEDEEHYASEDRQPNVRGKMGDGPDDVPEIPKSVDDLYEKIDFKP